MAKKNQYEDEEYHFIPRETQAEAAKSAQAKTIQDQANYWDTVAYNQTKPVGTNPSPLYDALSGMANYWEEQAYNATKPLESQKNPDTDTTPVYYGGGGGTQTTATKAAWDPQLPSFSYEDAPEFVSRYQGLIDEYLNGVLNRPAFSYNYETDPLYQQYAKSYGDAGRRAMQDTLAQISARTGGLASSYAGSASQQAYNQYMARLADKVPELQQLAYQMWQDEDSRARSNLSLLQGMDATDYGRYTDRLGQYNTDRSFAYNAAQDEYEKEMALRQLFADYDDLRGIEDLGVDLTAYRAKQAGSGGGSGGTTKSDARSRIETYGGLGYDIRELPEELLAAAGYSQQELDAMADYYLGVTPGSTPTPKKDPTATPAARATGVYTGGNASLDYSEDEGTFTWNGRVYTPSAFANALDNAALTDEEKSALTKKLKMYGFDITIN